MVEVGRKIVYGRDVCTIKERLDNYKDGEAFYVLTPIDDPTLVIRAPESRIRKIGRPVILPDEIEELLLKIPSIQTIKTDDRQLENTYRSLLDSNSCEGLISIIKTAYLRNETKLSKGLKRGEKDKVYFRMAEQALYGEFSVALGKTYEETKDYVISRVRSFTPQ